MDLNGSNKLVVRDLHVYYDCFHALKNINLSLESQQITALIGPSGCGKSTFLRVLNRMNDLIKGTRVKGDVLLDGKDIYCKDVDLVALRKRVGMVFQEPNPFPKSIYDNVAYGPRIHGIRKKRVLDELVKESLKKAALFREVEDRLKESALDLSGGQKQRLCIARALAVKPEVLLMDEPASSLDPVATARIEELIGQLKRDYTIIIVTHNMQQAARVSDYTAFFLMGEMVEYDKTEIIFKNPTDERTEDYITGRFG